MAEDKLKDILRKYQRKYISEIGKGIKKYDIAGTGALLTSFKVGQPRVQMFGGTYVMKIEALEYWEYINYGRRPSKKGSKPGKLKPKIEEWLRLPNIQQKLTSGGRGKYEGGSDDEWDKEKIESVAQLITSKIHARGYEARPFVSEARKTLDDIMFKDVADAALEQASIKLDEIITFINSN